MPETYRAVVVTAAGAGFRQGELFGLEVGHLDFLRRAVRVEQQLITLPGRPLYVAPPKTDASRRTVPLPDVVIEALAKHLAAYPSDSFVFRNTAGRPIRRNTFGDAWRRAAAATLGHASATETLNTYAHLWPDSEGQTRLAVDLVLGATQAAERQPAMDCLTPDVVG